MLLCLLADSIGPKPRYVSASATKFGVPPLTFSCVLDSGAECLAEHFEAFDFFSRGFYATGTPRDDYSSYGIQTIPAVVRASVLETPHYSIIELNESYTINVSAAGIAIVATNGMALARALQTLAQIIVPLAAEDASAYYILGQDINDSPVFKFRGLNLDVTKTFLPVKTLKTVIDGLAAAKMNVLHLRLIGEYSAPASFTTEPANRIIDAAYGQDFAYSMDAIRDLQLYGRPRGVFILPEISNPNHVASLADVFPGLVMNCTTREMDSLNPVDDRTQEVLSAIFTDLQSTAFQNASMRHMIHLSNDGYDQSCWEKNPDVIAFMQSKGVNSSEVYQQYVKNATTNLKKVYEGLEYPNTFYYEEVLQASAGIDKDSIIHFQSSSSLNWALEKGFYAIRSTCWELDKMWPIPTPTFYYGELWKDIFTIDILSGVSSSYKDRVLGGEASMRNDAGSQNIFEHIFPKLFSIGEVLWANEPSRSSSSIADRLQSEICLMKRLGMSSGPLWPSAPCWFE